MRFFIPLVLGLIVSGHVQAGADAPRAREPHVRTLDRSAARLFALGMSRSPTFRRLVTRLDASDVIVFVEARMDLRAHLGGTIHFLSETPYARFLVVHLNRLEAVEALVAILGHELQHAVEVADAHQVVSAHSFRQLYEHVGVQTGPDSYDSLEARRVGYVVRAEERGRHRDVGRASLTPSEALPTADDAPGTDE
jgi:hypothetical protein